MSDPVIRQMSVRDYMAANHPVEGFKPVSVKLSTAQSAADLERLRTTIAADNQAAAAAREAFLTATAPRVDDVAAMRPEQAQARLDQLVGLKRVGFLHCVGTNAVNGDQKTSSVETYMEWLGVRAGSAGSSAATPPPLFDVTV